METSPVDIQQLIKESMASTLQESLKTMAGPIFQEMNKAAEDREAAREQRLQQSIEKAFQEQNEQVAKKVQDAVTTSHSIL